MTITKDQLKVGTWIEFHDCFGGKYQGRVIFIRPADCRALIENILVQPSSNRFIEDRILCSTIKEWDMPGEEHLFTIPDYIRGIGRDPYPWIVKIMDGPPATSDEASSGVSALGKFLSDANRYTNGPEGEVDGCPAGWEFL